MFLSKFNALKRDTIGKQAELDVEYVQEKKRFVERKNKIYQLGVRFVHLVL